MAIKLEREERNLKERDALLAPQKNNDAHDTTAAVENKGKGNDKGKGSGGDIKNKKCHAVGGAHFKTDCPKKDGNEDVKATPNKNATKGGDNGKGTKNANNNQRTEGGTPAAGGKGTKVQKVRDSNGKTLWIYYVLGKCTCEPCTFSH